MRGSTLCTVLTAGLLVAPVALGTVGVVEHQFGYGIPICFSVTPFGDDATVAMGNLEGFIHLMGFEDETYIAMGTSSDLGIACRISSADFDGDGRMEVAVATTGDFIVFLEYWERVLLEEGRVDIGSSSVELMASDSDRDGLPEVLARTWDGRLVVLGYEGGRYCVEWQSVSLGEPAHALGLDVGDTDGDGEDEIAIEANAYIHLFGSDGEGGYVLEWKSEDFGTNVLSVGVGDADSDGRAEIFIGKYWWTIYVYGYDGTQYREEVTIEGFHPLLAMCLRVEDVDLDGVEELIAELGVDYDGYLWIYQYDVSGYSLEWQSENCFVAGLPGSGLGIGDADGDLRPEIFYSNFFGQIYVFGHNGFSYEREWRNEELGAESYGVALGDVDSDGDVEICAGDEWGRLYVEGWDGSEWVEEWRSEDFGSHLWGVAVDNLDDDEHVEIATGDYDGMIRIFGFDGSGYRLEWESSHPLGYYCFGMAIGDVDNDSDNELVTATSDWISGDDFGGYLWVLSFQSGEYIVEWKSDPIDARVYGLSLDDLDGNGMLEIVASSDVSTYKFQYNGEIYEELWAQAEGGWGVGTGDVDGDGEPEFVHGLASGVVRVRDGVTFGLEWESEDLGYDAFGICVDDLDNDGEDEILVGVGSEWVKGGVGLFEHDHMGYRLEWYSEEFSYRMGRYDGMVVGDVDGDVHPEVVMGSKGYLWVMGFDPPAPVTVTVSPDTVAVQPGGSVEYHVSLVNHGQEPDSIDVWADVILPNGKPYPGNPVVGPRAVTIPGGKTIERDLIQPVPVSAPLGAYTYWVRLGRHPQRVIDQDCIIIHVVE
jgi:hypothetical protein